MLTRILAGFLTTGGATYTLTASPGSFSQTGNTASLLLNRAITASSGSFALTGNAANLLFNRAITAGNGAFTLSGNAAPLLFNRALVASNGAFTLTGNNATLSYSPTGATYTLTAGAGIYTLSGQAAALLYNRALSASAGTFIVTGNNATLSYIQGTVARPNGDAAAGAWLPSTGVDLYAMIDETTYDDTDYIYANSASTCSVSLNGVADPGTSSGQVVSYRAWSPTGNGLTVRLKQGVTTIATWTHAMLPATATTYQQSLSASECDAITDYTALKLEFESVI